jgi:protein-disulfide isomerase
MKLALLLVMVTVGSVSAQPTRREPDRAKTYAVPVDGYPSDGPADAKVTLVIAHDYADPYSNKNRTTLDELRNKYGNDLRIVFRNMVVHPRNAMAGALASCAAHKQGQFEQMEDKLWEAFNQRTLDLSDVNTGTGPVKCWDTTQGCTHVVGFAKTLGLDVARFKSDMRACVKDVQADQQELQGQFAIGATPSFFINGRFTSGAMPTSTFETLIDEELAKANERIKAGTPKGRYYKKFVLEQGEKKVDAVAVPPTVGGAPPRPTRPEPDRALTYAVKVDGYPSKGPRDAKVSLVVIRDYASPFAERNRSVLDELVKHYGNDLRLVFRDRIIHPRNAMAGALAVCAAAKQNKFSELDEAMWDKGFKTRTLDISDVDTGNGQVKCWDTPEGCANVVGYAKDLGLDVTKFKSDMKKCVATVTADDSDLSQNLQVNATPGFFINGRYLAGAMPVDAFKQLVDDELAKANERIKKGTSKARYYKTWVIDKGVKKVAVP